MAIIMIKKKNEKSKASYLSRSFIIATVLNDKAIAYLPLRVTMFLSTTKVI
jgi:hypothetical protein